MHQFLSIYILSLFISAFIDVMQRKKQEKYEDGGGASSWQVRGNIVERGLQGKLKCLLQLLTGSALHFYTWFGRQHHTLGPGPTQQIEHNRIFSREKVKGERKGKPKAEGRETDKGTLAGRWKEEKEVEKLKKAMGAFRQRKGE